jgi:hypothetical protein
MSLYDRLKYMTGLHTAPAVVQRACTLLGTLDVREGFAHVCDEISNGSMRYFGIDTVRKDEVTGKMVPVRKTFIHAGFRPDGRRLITDDTKLRERADESSGLSLTIKESLDHTATTPYRCNPELMLIARNRPIGKGNDDYARLQQEVNTFGVYRFFLPKFIEERRSREHTDCKGSASYSGSDGCRGTVEYETPYTVDDENREYAYDILGQMYDLTVMKAYAIRAAGADFFDAPEKFGYQGNKPCCAFTAAGCVVDMSLGLPTHYILQQDATQSGFQGAGMTFGCPTLCHLTNLGDGEKQDFYTEVSDLVVAPMPPESVLDANKGLEDLLTEISGSRAMAKFMIMRIGYGASTDALVKALLIHNAQKSRLVLRDFYGNLCDVARQALSKNEQIRNHDYGHIWAQMGWDHALTVSSSLARGYQEAIFALSPRLREGTQCLTNAARSALDVDKVLTMTSPAGFEYRLFQPGPDLDGDSIRLRQKVNGVEIAVTMKPLVNRATASMLAPDFQHTNFDSSVIHIKNRVLAKEGIPASDIHDSSGSSPAFALRVREATRDAYLEVGPQLPVIYRDILAEWGETDKNLCGGADWDMDLLSRSDHFIGG